MDIDFVYTYSSATLTNISATFIVVPIMYCVSTVLLLGSLAVQSIWAGPVLGSQRQISTRDSSLEKFIVDETQFAWGQLLCNIGADGCHASGVARGVVIASPSKESPPYFYTWTRDSALVFKAIIDQFTDSYNTTLQRHIMEYIASQAHLQGVPNRSGGLSDGAGLGEPKFNVDESAFTGDWGRPQRDGPALRAISIMAYGEWLVDNGYKETATKIVWPVIRNDLEYVAQYWNLTGFDLWEEVQGSSFFTSLSQYKALVQGASFASSIGQPSNKYATIASSILCFVQDFWSPSKNYIVANINTGTGRTGLDANTVLGSIHMFDPQAACDAVTFQPCSDRALSNLKALVDSFRFYNINKGIAKGNAIAIGRYAEDVYYNGNPWYLNTLAVAEQMYDAVYMWRRAGELTVTKLSLGFFLDIFPNAAVGTYKSGSDTFESAIQAVTTYADGFVGVVAKYSRANGSLDEQFSKDNGAPLSAADLTWSYAAFLTAVARRTGQVPEAWLQKGSAQLPAVCSSSTAQGSYTSATYTVFPPSQTPGGSEPEQPTTTTTSEAPPTTTTCSIASRVTLTLKVAATTVPGQTIKVVGSTQELANWNPANGIALDASEYTSNSPTWKGKVVLPAGAAVEYKYIRVERDGTVKWEADPNRKYQVPKSCASTATQQDKWQV